MDVEWKDDVASMVGAESDRKMRISFDRCVLVLDKVFRDRNVPFVQFPGSFCS